MEDLFDHGEDLATVRRPLAIGKRMRKPEPPDEDDVLVLPLPSQPPETFRRNQRPGETGHGHDEHSAATQHEQAKVIRRFVHDHARALHVLAARLVGRKDAATVAQEAIANLARRICLQPLWETRALAKAPQRLWRLTCKIMACRAHEHLRNKRRDLELEGDRLERAHDALSPAERIVYILHYYYRFADSDFEIMFHLSKVHSQRLVHRALSKLKRAMGEQRVKQ
jgi:DNA-directed RNA polymerase specialized sigma24 family protein